jgi:phenylalanyl-tRNA synthetase beta chain
MQNMKFSEAWLREWVNPPISSRAMGDCLTMGGLALDDMNPAALAFTGVVVARVIDVAPHPVADNLSVCQVNHTGDQSLQVVCGAPNVRAGMRVPFARVGAVLPGGVTIEAAHVRNVESCGMLCSAGDLRLAETSTEIMLLPADAPIGQSLRDYLNLDDMILEIDLTPNRSDCLSIAGIARELAALTDTALDGPVITRIGATINDSVPIAIEVPENCPRYAGRVIRSITPGLTTPLWLQERLRRSGLRSLNPAVDVMNYVMLELGQPMHAFDLSTLRGGIHVRHARENEPLTLLDGREIVLADSMLVIADDARALALAGIMGGQDSAVNNSTRDVFLESAFFAPQAIAGKARMYGLNTDSSYRFERGVDPDLQVRAMQRATKMLLEIVDGEAGPIIDIAYPEYLPKRPIIVLRPARVEQLLGIAVAPDRVAQILRSLGCEVEQRNTSLAVVPPSARFDLGVEADLIEEVGRIYGYDRIPATTPAYRPVIRPQPETAMVKRLRVLLVDRGYQEAITYSFVDADTSRLFSPELRLRHVANPISAELTIMRSNLWPGLIKAVRYNFNRQQRRIRLFELGRQFIDTKEGLQEKLMLAAVATGNVLSEQWGVPPREIDFYDIKGDVEALLGLSNAAGKIEFQPEPYPALHSGQSARITFNGQEIGRLGALHPAVAKSLEINQRIFVFDLALDKFKHERVPHFRQISKFPAIRRDIAIVVDESITAAQIRGCVVAAGGERLQECRVFDVYRGEGVAMGTKSLALGLILQDFARTLHDEEVDAIVSRVVSELTQTFGASLRG